MPSAAVEKLVSIPANSSHSSAIAGSVLPIARAEELLATLPGVIAARIVPDDKGAVGEIHVLTTPELTPKQTVRNIESALVAQLGMKVDHRKISVATSTEKRATPAEGTKVIEASSAAQLDSRRRIYFEDVEVRRSRSSGVSCRVTLRKGEQSFIGETDGVENERSRVELAAQATLKAIALAEGPERALALLGCKQITAFERDFVFAGVTARFGRDTAMLTGSCEVRDSLETASVLAVLDATNRWIAHVK
jgi:hypothetical protein